LLTFLTYLWGTADAHERCQVFVIQEETRLPVFEWAEFSEQAFSDDNLQHLLALARSAPHPLLLFALAYFTEFGTLVVHPRPAMHAVRLLNCVVWRVASCGVVAHRGHVPTNHGRGGIARRSRGVPEPAASGSVRGNALCGQPFVLR
jgi:hypothetical protein